MFNPPYVTTDSEELSLAQERKGIEAAWAGGRFGIQVLEEFLPQAKQRLTPLGVIYLLLIDQNMPLVPMLTERFGFTSADVIVKREVTDERQFVIRLSNSC